MLLTKDSSKIQKIMNRLESALKVLGVYDEFEYEFWMDRFNQTTFESVDDFVEERGSKRSLSYLLTDAIIFGDTDQGSNFWWEVDEVLKVIDKFKEEL